MSRLFKKTLIMIVLLFGVISTITSTYAGWILYSRIIEEYKSKAIAIANNIAQSSVEIILNRDASTVQSIVDQYSQIEGVSYVLVVHRNGEIISHTFAPKVPYELLKEVERPRENHEEVIATNVKLENYGSVLDVSSPILSGVAGYVHVGMNLEGVRNYIWTTIIKLHMVAFAIFLVTVAIAWVFTGKISRPLIELSHYAEKVANRDFSEAIEIRSKDEVGVLAKTMTNMAREIKTQMATLEQKVADATHDLQDTLGFLSAIIDNLADGLLVMDPDGKISRANISLIEMLELNRNPHGESVRVLLGRTASDFLYSKGHEVVDAASIGALDLNHQLSLRESLSYQTRANTTELTATRADGSLFPIELSASVVNMKGVCYTIGIVRDITGRKRAEDALRLSEEKYRGMFEQAVEGIFQTDARGRLINANPASAHILGYDSSEELLRASKKLGNDIYADSGRQAEFISLMREGQVVHGFEIEMLRKNGERIWAAFDARPIRNEIGELLATEGIVQDISDRKHAQEALVESERRYRELFAISPDPMIVHREGRIILANQAAADFFRVASPETLQGMAMKDFVHSDSYNTVVERIKQAESFTISSDFSEVRFVRADDSIAYLESIAVPTTYGGEKAVLCIGRDVTERKEAEDALRISEERFRTIFEIAPDCIFLKDFELRYTHVNPSVETLFGVSASEIIGKRAEDFFGHEAASHIRDGDLRVLAGETIEDEHTRPVRGMNLTFHDIRTPLRNIDGTVIGVCKFSRNITDRKGAVQLATFTERAYRSEAMITTLEHARRAAQNDGIILLLGESGSGKDYLARWIHSKSKRADAPFFSLNCAAISPELAESELFGHERGAFTGAVARKKGLLELAEGGTLLLNEIGELSLSMQSKLLTFLDTRSFTRVGGEKNIRVNARLIAATHRNLEEEMAAGRFIEPLYYRLNVYVVLVPPLRKRLDDIPVIVEEILLNLATEMQLSQVPTLDQEALRKLMSYPWRGNLRELRNVLERAVMLSSGPILDLRLPSVNDTSEEEWSHEVRFRDFSKLSEVLDDVTRSLCREALRRTGGSRKDAATFLGISRQSLYRYMKTYGLLAEYDTID